MVSRIVISNRCVEAAGGCREIAVHSIGELVTFDVGTEYIGGVRAQYNLGQEAQMIGELGGHKQIELARLKTGVWRRERIPARSASIGDDRKYQRIRDGSDAKIKVEESSNIQDRAAWYGHVVATHVPAGHARDLRSRRRSSIRRWRAGGNWRGGAGHRCRWLPTTLSLQLANPGVLRGNLFCQAVNPLNCI